MQDEVQKIKTDKIFVDHDEDIVFVADAIRQSEGDRIILLVQEHAILVSSLINLKILSKLITKTKKIIILVTKSELAKNKAKQAYLVAVEKVDDINIDIWNYAKQLKDKLIEDKENLKQTLLAQRQENRDPNDTESEKSEQIENPTAYVEKVPEKFVEAVYVERNPRIEPIITNIGNFKVLCAGDISKHPEYLEEEKIHNIETRLERRLDQVKSNEDETRSPIKLESEEDDDEDIDDQPERSQFESIKFGVMNFFQNIKKTIRSFKSKKRGKNFIGKDIAKLNISAPKYKPSANLPGYNQRKNAVNIKYNSFEKIFQSKLLKRILIFVILVYAILFVSANMFSKVKINMVLNSENVSLTDTVVATKTINSIDVLAKKLPLREVTKSKGESGTAVATGKDNKGTKATGVIDILNKTDKEITLEKGKVINVIGSNLKFILSKTIKVPPRPSETFFYRYENAEIEASDYGEEYNLPGEKDISVEGYNTLGELSGRMFRPTQGGKSDMVTVVSEEDVTNLKNAIMDSLKKNLSTEIDKSLAKDEIKIPNTETFKEVSFEVSPAIGEKADEFNIVNLEYEIKVSIVSQDDVEAIADKLILSEYGADGNANIQSKQNASITNVRIKSDSEIQFDILKEGSIKGTLDKLDFQSKIKGKKLTEIATVVDSLSVIKTYDVEYSPFFVPQVMRKIPDNKDRIEIIY